MISFTHIEVNITIFINSAYIKTTTNIILQFFCLMYFPCLSSIVHLFLINHGGEAFKNQNVNPLN